VADERPLPTTAYAVLGLLSFGRELSGYDLKKWSDASLRHFFWSPAVSNIYGELKRLEGLGYVSAREVPQDDLRNKRVFRITPVGTAALARWVEDSPADPPVLKDHTLLRIWMGHVTGREQLLAMVTAAEDAARTAVDELRHNVEVSRADPSLGYSALVEEWCLREQEARADAFAELRAAIEALPDQT
jgi:DNA-binding PadR family transcriptional regulator